eukprot:Nk52_evm3s374 gene=Nk52_evmTU3s374
MSKGDRKCVTAIVVGAGQRGAAYASYAKYFPERLQIVGVADPKDFYRKKFQNLYNIPAENCFVDWKDLAKRPKFADAVIIATPDVVHRDPAVAFANLKYHILLEKPLSNRLQECEEITAACKENDVFFSVGHVLRYAPWNQKIKELIVNGAIGEVVNIQHIEPIGFQHVAHSFVRGNWGVEEKSSFSLLAKSCHDVDLIKWWMNKDCRQVSSFGSLFHFRSDRQPSEARGATRCMGCPIKNECPYSAKRIYLDPYVDRGHTSWPVDVITESPHIESINEALEKGPYGRCVYHCDNDVMDQQTAIMQFDDGSTGTFSMIGFTEKQCERETIVYGTKGEIRLVFDASKVTQLHSGFCVDLYSFVTKKHTVYNDCGGIGDDIMGEEQVGIELANHGGADYFLIKAFVDALATNDRTKIVTGPDDTLDSHRLVFEMEKARRGNCVVKLDGK